MTRKETEAAVLDRAQREIREFAEATGSTTPLAHLARIVVGTLPFEAKVTAKLASTIEKTRITSEWSGASEEEALHDLQTYAKSIDETDQWLETHLGKSIAFETKRVRHRDCLEVCGSCSGSGRGTCPQCHGARKVNCTSWNCRGGKVPCDRFDCKDGYHPCGVCGGWCYIKKWVTEGHNESGPIKNLRSVQCSNCSGSGKGVACVNCRGSSWVTCSTCGGASRVTCDTCRGSGDVICGSCNGQGHLSHRLTLRLTVSTTRRYQSRARVEVERLCERSPDFQAQINSAPRWNLTYSSSGQTGHYFYEGSASYAELVVDDEPLLLAGHPDRPARATAALYAPVLQEFFPLIDRLDVTRLKTSRLAAPSSM